MHLAEPADTAFARGRKRHAKTDKTDCRHMRMLLAEGRLPECWTPPGHILECRALLELYHDLRAEHTTWVQRIHAVLFHQGAPDLGEGARGFAARALRAPVTRPPARRTRQLSGTGRRLRHPQTRVIMTAETPESNACGHRRMQVRRITRRYDPVRHNA